MILFRNVNQTPPRYLALRQTCLTFLRPGGLRCQSGDMDLVLAQPSNLCVIRTVRGGEMHKIIMKSLTILHEGLCRRSSVITGDDKRDSEQT